MGSVLQIGGSPSCGDMDKADLKQEFKDLRASFSGRPIQADAVLKALKEFGTLSLCFSSPKPPGFFQKSNIKCYMTGTEVIESIVANQSPGSSPTDFLKIICNNQSAELPFGGGGGSVRQLRATSPLGDIGDSNITKIFDNISFFKGEVIVDQVKVGLVGIILFLVIVVFLLLVFLRRPSYASEGMQDYT